MIDYIGEYAKAYQDKSRIYYIESFLKTFDAMERKEVPFLLFPRQKVFLHSCAENGNTVASKHRQSGVSTISAGFAAGQCVFASKDSPEIILVIANKLDQAIELVNKIIAFLEMTPRWLWGGSMFSPDPMSEKNKIPIFVKKNKGYIELFNGCKIYARASSPNAARGISSVTLTILDEAAFIQEGVASFTSAMAAMSAVAGAKCIMVSTPNGKDQLYYKTYSSALKGENNFTAVEFKWYQDLRYNRFLKWYKTNSKGETIFEEERVLDKKGNIPYDEERWKRLEREGWKPTSPWFENMCKSFNNNQQMIAQEIEISFLGSADNVVATDVIEYHRDTNVINVNTDEWFLKDLIVKETWIWKDPIPGHRYICGVDPSSGSGNDNTAIEIIDIDAVDENGVPYFEQVLEYNGKLNGEEVGALVDKYGRIYNNAYVVVECIGGYGDSVVLTLLKLGYPNLYYDQTQVLNNYTADYLKQKMNRSNNNSQLPGFRSGALRIQMISNFVECLKNNSFRVRSQRVIQELETWVFQSGRPNHMAGMHDDTLTCLSMTLFVLQFYMLKSERNKEKDSAIVSSWRVNNNTTSGYNSLNMINGRTSGSIINDEELKYMDEAINKMLFDKDVENRRENNFIGACIMLGGFGRYKQ